MKLYFSFGYVQDDGKSVRLYHMEEPIEQATVGKLVSFVQSYMSKWL